MAESQSVARRAEAKKLISCTVPFPCVESSYADILEADTFDGYRVVDQPR
jgi:hypothetical protein